MLDPLLGDRMREHQKLGLKASSSAFCLMTASTDLSTTLKFMYDCVMGMKKVEGQGVIMADEMSVILRRGLARCMLTVLHLLYAQQGAGKDSTDDRARLDASEAESLCRPGQAERVRSASLRSFFDCSFLTFA